jgi:hypothetical protein
MNASSWNDLDRIRSGKSTAGAIREFEFSSVQLRCSKICESVSTCVVNNLQRINSVSGLQEAASRRVTLPLQQIEA